MADPTTTTETRRAELFPTPQPNLPAEIVREITALAEQQAREPRILAVLAARDIEAAATYAHQLQAASIKMTFPEDWVIFKSRDGAELCYLQDAGCQRVRPLWAISFEKLDRERDVIETMVPAEGDEDITIEVVINGDCALTGESQSEVGFRSSTGFFEKAWRDSKDKPVARAKVRMDILKSAIINGRGRLIRTFSGLGQVPVERLVQAGLMQQRVRGAQFQAGTKGGSGTGAGASEPQIQAIIKSAYNFNKVKLLGAAIGREDFEKLVRSAGLTGGREGTASKIIDRMTKAQPSEVTIEEFEQLLGVSLPRPEPGSNDE